MADAYQGQQSPGDEQGGYAAQAFLVRQILSRVNTCTLVKVLACTNSGGVSPVGYVDAQPLVNQTDGAGNATPHGTLHHLPYHRIQGGESAVIIDPAVGDIGIAVFADHDISAVKKNKARSNPGSWARFSMSDGLYIGGVLNGSPSQYVQFSGDGITITSPAKITLNAPEIAINATGITSAGNWAHTGTMNNNETNIGHDHRHSGVQTGTGATGTPI